MTYTNLYVFLFGLNSVETFSVFSFQQKKINLFLLHSLEKVKFLVTEERI